MHTLEADSIRLSFGSRIILSDIYLKCKSGQITGLLGRNGAGKSCLMQIIFGSLKADHKMIRLDASIFESVLFLNDQINYLPQFNFILPGRRIDKIFNAFCANFEEFNALFPSEHVRQNQMFQEYSMGQRRLMEVFLIVKAKTKFTLMDEPFSYIMPIHLDRIKQLILSAKQSKGFIMSDHLYSNILSLSDQVFLLKDGRNYLIRSEADLIKLGYINHL